MKFLTVVATLAVTALAGPSVRRGEPCTAGSYRCGAGGKSIDVCNAQHEWVEAGRCPDHSVCKDLPQNGFELPFCVDPNTKKRNDDHPQCTPAAYACAHNPKTGAPGIKVCDTQGAWRYNGDCPKNSHCKYFPSGIPYCVDNKVVA